MAVINKTSNNKGQRGGEGKRNLIHCWWECKWCGRYRKQCGGSSKLRVELPHDPAIPLLGIYPKNLRTIIRKDISTPVFTAALFTEAKTWRQPKCPLLGDCRPKVWYTYIQGTTAQPRNKMKYCHSQQHGWTWRISC